jgi:hypothetical protein
VSRQPWRPAIARIGVLAVCVVLLAAPYVAWLSANSGYLRWEGKSVINGIISGRMIAGATYQEAAYGLGPNLERLGPYLAADQFDIAATSGTGPGLVSTILADTVPRVVEIARLFAAPSGPGGPVLTLLAMVGLVASLLDRRHRVQKLFLAAAGASYLLILLSVQFYWDRYLFPFTLLALPWAATGTAALASLAARLAARSSIAAPRRQLAFAATAIAAIALVTIPSYRYASSDGEFTQSSNHVLRTAGLWLRDRQPATVMGISGVVAYYAGSTLVYLPWADEAAALGYIHQVRPDFIFLRHGDEPQRPYIGQWLADGIPDRCAVPVQTFPQDDGGQLDIYEWGC